MKVMPLSLSAGRRLVRILLFGVAVCFCPGAAQAQQHLEQRSLSAKPAKTKINKGTQRTDAVVVKFKDDLPLRARTAKLEAMGFTDGRLAALLARLEAAGATWKPRHDIPEARLSEMRDKGQKNTGRALPDLRTSFLLRLGPGQDAAALIDELNALDFVELAEAAPRPPPPPAAPDFEAKQVYLDAASVNGVNARAAWNIPGGNGAGVRIANVEYAYHATHTDVNVALIGPAPKSGSLQKRIDHGTAALGVLGSWDDGKGTTGIAHGAQIFFSAEETDDDWNRPGAISRAAAQLLPGDVMLLEMQTFGASYEQLVPAEWEKSVYDVVVTAAANGIIVVAAAGNGGANLDDSFFASDHAPFTLAGESGSLIVGAGEASGPNARSRRAFSCYGSTVDVQGWGNGVTTTGYGDLYSAEGPDSYYTAVFNGTSSASPVVAGSVACLQGAFRAANGGASLAVSGLKMLLRETGSPQTGNAAAEHIGPLPDLAAALPYVSTAASWVSFSHTGPENGSINYPFNTLPEVLASARYNVTVFVGRGTNSWTGKLTNTSATPALLRSAFGTVKLGKTP